MIFLGASVAHAQPNQAVAAALADVQKLPLGQAQRTRYLAMWGVPEANRDKDFEKVLAFWCNSLSRESELIAPRKINSDLYAVVLDDYGWDPKVWDKLSEADPYFHVTTETEGYDSWGYADPVTKKWVETEKRKNGKKTRTPALAPWIGTEASILALKTSSQAPVLRADWFIVYTGQQQDRAAGYYDFLGLGNKEADFQALIGADLAAAKRVHKEQAASVGRSSVTLNNRGIERFQSITGAYWRTNDFKASTDRKNTLRLLDGDTEPPKGDASEQYGTLPNGLFAFWLQNAEGVRQNAAPDFIASDGRAPGTDRRVHIGVSCIRCHSPGIQPINDWGRNLYVGDVRLGSPDYDRLKRLRQLYLSDLNRSITRDQKDYADALKTLNSLTPAANATAFARVHREYEQADLSAAQFAAELGVPEEKFKMAMTDYAKTKPLDPLLLGLVVRGLPLRREHAEELYSVAHLILGGVK
jgi:hypothetical protein